MVFEPGEHQGFLVESGARQQVVMFERLVAQHALFNFLANEVQFSEGLRS